MKILDLVLKKKWFDMIKDGDKREEYREIKPYWQKRLFEKDGTTPKSYTHVKFRYGYTKKSVLFRIEGNTTGIGKTEWGAPENTEVFIIKLAQQSFNEELSKLFSDVIKNNVKEYYDNGNVNITRLVELLTVEIRKMLSDDKLNFTSNDSLEEFKLECADEHTKEVFKNFT